MHTSLEVHPRTHCLSCEGARPTVPSPLVGEGQGEEYNMHCICFMLRPDKCSRPSLRVCGRDEPRARCLSPPLSLSLPHKGGGNAVALLCPVSTQHPRIRSQM